MRLTVGGIISKSFEMVKDRFGALVGMWAIYFAVQIVLMVALFLVVGASVASLGVSPNLANPAALGAGVIVFAVVFYIAYILIYCAQNASLNALASPLQRLDFGDAFAAGWRSALPLLGVMVLLVIAYFVCAITFGLVLGVLAFAGKVVAAIGVVAVVVAVIYLASRLSIIFPAVAVEGIRNPVTAISRSWSLTRGNVLPIFLAMLVFGVIAIVLFLIALLPVAGTFMSLARGSVGPAAVAPALGGMSFMFLAFLVVGVLVAISAAALQAVIHAQLSGSTGESLSETFA